MTGHGMDAIVRAMGPEERQELLELLLEAIEGELGGACGDGGESPGRCPRCGCAHVVRRGHDADGAQRWLCRGCGRSFRASTGRVLATTRLPAAKWSQYATLMLAGATLRVAAAECGVSLRTSFSMRHRLCEVMASMLPAFEAGTGCRVEADETFVPDSLSGNHTRNKRFSMPRPARRRGGDGVSRGLGDDKVAVLTMVNDRGDAMLAAACRGAMGSMSAARALAGCAVDGAIVSTDMLGGHGRALAEAGVAVHRRFSSKGSRAPLNHVNALHSALKAFLHPFRGVSTRRLPNYLVWFRWLREARRSGGTTDLLRRQMEGGTYRTTWRGLWMTPYPFHPELDVTVEG